MYAAGGRHGVAFADVGEVGLWMETGTLEMRAVLTSLPSLLLAWAAASRLLRLRNQKSKKVPRMRRKTTTSHKHSEWQNVQEGPTNSENYGSNGTSLQATL